MANACDAVSELLDKQLFSDSKSDIVTNVFTDALVKIVQPLSQGLSSLPPLVVGTDPGCGWSRDHPESGW